MRTRPLWPLVSFSTSAVRPTRAAVPVRKAGGCLRCRLAIGRTRPRPAPETSTKVRICTGTGNPTAPVTAAATAATAIRPSVSVTVISSAAPSTTASASQMMSATMATPLREVPAAPAATPVTASQPGTRTWCSCLTVERNSAGPAGTRHDVVTGGRRLRSRAHREDGVTQGAGDATDRDHGQVRRDHGRVRSGSQADRVSGRTCGVGSSRPRGHNAPETHNSGKKYITLSAPNGHSARPTLFLWDVIPRRAGASDSESSGGAWVQRGDAGPDPDRYGVDGRPAPSGLIPAGQTLSGPKPSGTAPAPVPSPTRPARSSGTSAANGPGPTRTAAVEGRAAIRRRRRTVMRVRRTE